MIDWKPLADLQPEDLPPDGRYLCTVATDDGPEVHTLDLVTKGSSRRVWTSGGEATYCLGYYFEPTHYALLPEPAVSS